MRAQFVIPVIVSILILGTFGISQDAYAVPQIISSDNIQTNDIVLTSVDGFIIDGDITITSTAGDVTFNGAIDASGTGGSLTINTPTGIATFNGAIGGANPLNSLTIASSNNVVLGSLNVQSLNVNSGGSITQTASITVVGTTSIIADSNVTLDIDTNDFGGAVSVSGASVSLDDTNSIVLGDIDASVFLLVEADGDISDGPSGALGDGINVVGPTTIIAGGVVTLDNDVNDFGGAVSVSGASVSLDDTNSIVLGDIDASGTLHVEAGVSITDAEFALVPGDAIDAVGQATFIAPLVTLDNVLNNFAGGLIIIVDSDGDGVFTDVDPDDNNPCNPNTNAPTCLDEIQDLIDDIGAELPENVGDSLIAPLENVIKLLDDDNPKNDGAVCGKLDAFENQINAKEGKKNGISVDQADALRVALESINTALGC